MAREPSAQALHLSRNDPSAFARFYDAQAVSVLRFFVRRTYDAETAFDLMAETFAQAYLSRGRFRGRTDAAAGGWLFRIARRQLARYLKRQVAERRALNRLGAERPELEDDQLKRIEDLADLGELRLVLRSELGKLSRAEREALQLRVVEELTYSEVAARLGIQEPAARARVSRGLRTLAEAMDAKTQIKEAKT